MQATFRTMRSCSATASSMHSGRKAIAKHREPAKGLRFGRLVLKNVPMLGELAVFEAHDIGGDPRRGTAVAQKTPMGHHVVAFREDQLVFVAERGWKAADKIEQAVAAGR